MDKYSLKDDGSNFSDWEMHLRLAAQADGKEQFLVTPVPPMPASDATQIIKDSYDVYLKESSSVKNVLIFAMAPALQRRMIHLSAYHIFVKLTSLFSKKPRILQYEAAVRFFEARLQKGQSVGPHVLRMIEYVETLEQLGNPITNEIVVDRILHSLHEGYTNFRVNFNMNDLKKTPHELLPLLIQAEKDLMVSGSNKRDVLSVKMNNKGKGKNKKGKGKQPQPSKGKGKGVASTKTKATKDGNSAPICFHCGKEGHWRRNCPDYLKELRSSSGIYMIEMNYASSTSWVLDTGCGSHLCNNLQGMRSVRQLLKGEVDLRVGNGAKIAAVSVGTYVLSLSSGFEMYLNNCYYVPTLSKSLISVSVLAEEGFSFVFDKNGCTFSFNDMVYGVAISINGIYILDLSNKVYHIEDKKLKTGDPNLSYLRHYRSGHANENRIKRLVSNGVLSPFDYDDSFGTCESCLMGKMTRAPFTGKGV